MYRKAKVKLGISEGLPQSATLELFEDDEVLLEIVHGKLTIMVATNWLQKF